MNLSTLYAGMVELADSEDLGSSAKWRAGSNPATSTNKWESEHIANSPILYIMKYLK